MINFLIFGFIIHSSFQIEQTNGGLSFTFDCIADAAELTKEIRDFLPLLNSTNRDYNQILPAVKRIIKSGETVASVCGIPLPAEKMDIGKCADGVIEYAQILSNLTNNFNQKTLPSVFNNLTLVVGKGLALYETCSGNLLTGAQIGCVGFLRQQIEFVAKLSGSFNQGNMTTKELVTRIFEGLAGTPAALDNCGYVSLGRYLRTATKNVLNADCMDDARRMVLSVGKLSVLFQDYLTQDSLKQLFNVYLLAQHLNDHCFQEDEFIDDLNKEEKFLRFA